ncbi:Spectrin beta chain, non-erythrocytic 2, partial [Frankliniella fusca]
MFSATAGRVKSYYLASGGAGAGSGGLGPGGDGVAGPRQSLGPLCQRPPPPASASGSAAAATTSGRGPRSLVANLKKTQSSLHVPLGGSGGAEEALGLLGRRARKSRSLGDLTHYARHFNKCRRAGCPLPMDRVPLHGALDGVLDGDGARARARGVCG